MWSELKRPQESSPQQLIPFESSWELLLCLFCGSDNCTEVAKQAAARLIHSTTGSVSWTSTHAVCRIGQWVSPSCRFSECSLKFSGQMAAPAFVPLHRSTPLIQRSWRQQLFLYFSFVPEMLHRSTFIELAKNLLGVAHPGEPVLPAHTACQATCEKWCALRKRLEPHSCLAELLEAFWVYFLHES